MADLQASIDFSVELGAFYNIDLFQRGYVKLLSQLFFVPLDITLGRPTFVVRPSTYDEPVTSNNYAMHYLAH